ncbi:SufS family cysteine desulfurase [Streptomyces sp. 1222.5]|uniref:SufS family cysteine desulfurase n=1 Tax=Streptomyces sp. 1222.5 TaxID=1881026 RepID=UPI003EBD7404
MAASDYARPPKNPDSEIWSAAALSEAVRRAGKEATKAGPSTERSQELPYFQRYGIENERGWESSDRTSSPLEVQQRQPYFLESSSLRGEAHPSTTSLGIQARRDFPALAQRVNGHRLIWLDNAATTQKPRVVINKVHRFYETDNSNIHRAAHTLAARATDAYEHARSVVARFLGSQSPEQIVFVRGTTEAINLIAHSAGQRFITEGDEIVVTELEHHSNIVPWQLLCERSGAVLKVLPVDDRGNLRLDALYRVIGGRTKIVAVTQVANSIGTVVPVCAVSAAAHSVGALVVVDGAQSAAHFPVDVTELDADFYAFSGHKVYGPTGIGVLYGKRNLLETMPPWHGGGSMINQVTFERTTYAQIPAKFEAGTGHIAGAVGLAAALEYVDHVGRSAIERHEHVLMEHLLETLEAIPLLRIVANPDVRAGSVSFVVDGFEPARVAAHLDRHGIAVRAGHHCAQPLLRHFGLVATVRPSLGLYNCLEDVETLGACLRRLVRSS